MDFQFWPLKKPIKVMMINSLIMASKMAIMKILSGTVFGSKQLIDITLLVYTNELPRAKQLIQEIKSCNFGYLNTITATTDLPRITDAHVFCVYTNFKNPFRLDFDNINTDEQFDSFYLLIKVTQSLLKSALELPKSLEKVKKPIIIGDGLIAIDIMNIMGLHPDMVYGYFCPSGLPSATRTYLSNFLKVHCTDINVTYLWGVDDLNFHIEVEKPYVVHDKIRDKKHCDEEIVSNELLETLNLDSSQFNASWMKKEFIEKLKHVQADTIYGPIQKSWKVNRCLAKVWRSRLIGRNFYISLGTISDGSLRTIKGLPYFLPLVFGANGLCSVHHRFSDSSHLRLEIKRYNVIAQKSHAKLVKYCHKFYEDNIINKLFIPPDSDVVTISSTSLGPSSVREEQENQESE